MDQEPLDSEIKQILGDTRLKKPPEELMNDYLTGVHQKINSGFKVPHFGLPQLGMVLAVGLVLALAFFFLARPKQEIRTISGDAGKANLSLQEMVPDVPEADKPNTLSLEEQLTLLETFDDNADNQLIDLLGDEQLAAEMSLLDEMELVSSQASMPGFAG